ASSTSTGSRRLKRDREYMAPFRQMPVFFAGELRWSPVRRLLGAECLSREATGGGDERGACSAAGQGQRGRFARAARSAGELAAAHLQARGWLRARGSG